jgi:hypothetical protein
VQGKCVYSQAMYQELRNFPQKICLPCIMLEVKDLSKGCRSYLTLALWNMTEERAQWVRLQCVGGIEIKETES